MFQFHEYQLYHVLSPGHNRGVSKEWWVSGWVIPYVHPVYKLPSVHQESFSAWRESVSAWREVISCVHNRFHIFQYFKFSSLRRRVSMKFEVYIYKNTYPNHVCQCDKIYRFKFRLSQVIQILNRQCDD